MNNIRIIPRLDIKGRDLIKSIQFEGLRKLGDPANFAKKYYDEGADELLYMDIVASLYGRNNLLELSIVLRLGNPPVAYPLAVDDCPIGYCLDSVKSPTSDAFAVATKGNLSIVSNRCENGEPTPPAE